MFIYATLGAGRWSGPFESFGRQVDLGRGVDGDLSFATGFDDPGLPRADSLTWHIGATRYDLNASYGDIVALARSMIANIRFSAPQRLRVAPPIARVMARRIEPGLAVGVAVLRRLTPTPIFVPRAPAIDSSIQLFPQGQGGTAAGYTYFLCRTVQCASRDTVAEVAVSPEATANTRATPNVDLACGVRGSFIGISETAFSAQLSWHDRGLAFTILSARKNPSNTDIVALARSIVANASTCRTRLIRR